MTQPINLEELDLKANLGAFSTFDSAVCVPEIQKLTEDQTYLEVGVDKGKSLSIARMVAKKSVNVFGVDLREDPQVPNTVFIRGNSQEVAETWGQLNGGKIDVIFIDADHSYEGCKADIDSWFPHMAKEGVMLFHDADETSPGVVKAIEEFAKNNNLTVWYSPEQRCSMARIYLNA